MIKRLPGAAIFVCLLLAAPASASVTCSYRQIDPAGPRDDYLKIRAGEIEDQAAVVRRGQRIRVTDDRTGAPVSCSGGTATITNIDRIVFMAAADGAGLFISLAGGQFEPGATTTGRSPEIEITAMSLARFPGNIGIGGSRGADGISIANRAPGGRTRVNLDTFSDSLPNLTFPSPVVGILVRGGRGNDAIAGSGIGTRLSLSAYAGPGRDRVLGGASTDLLFGRSGADIIDGRGGADELDCGPGNDFARVEPRDRVTGCERRRPAKAPWID